LGKTTNLESLHSQIKPLREIAEIYPGYSPKREERLQTGEYLLVGGRNINNGRLILTDKDAYVNYSSRGSFNHAITQPGDIIISTLFDRRKLYIYQKQDPKAVINNSCAIIRAPETNDYIISYLKTIQGQSNFLSQASKVTSGNFIPRLSTKDLAEIPIPILPLTELQLLGDTHIESSSQDELVALRNSIQGKDVEITQLKEKINSLQGKEAEIEKLKSEMVQVTTYYEDRLKKIEAQISVNDLKARITHDETSKLEFKSSLRWNIRTQMDDPEIELAVLKTIAAFCNSQGSELLIGIADNKTILGISLDHFPNNDKFLLHLRNLIVDKLIPSVIPYVDYEIVSIDDKQICHVKCRQSTDDIWLKSSKTKDEIFYVRSGPSSNPLAPREASRYIREHFSK